MALDKNLIRVTRETAQELREELARRESMARTWERNGHDDNLTRYNLGMIQVIKYELSAR